MQYFIVGHSAGAGDAEAIKLVESTGLSIGQLYSVGVAYMIVTVAEIMTGIISAKFSNRLDKVKICLYADIVLMVVMILQQSYMMLLARMFNPFALVAGILNAASSFVGNYPSDEACQEVSGSYVCGRTESGTGRQSLRPRNRISWKKQRLGCEMKKKLRR